MKSISRNISIFLAIILSMASICSAQDITLEPKFGLVQKSAEQKNADVKFLAAVDAQFKGDRKTATDQIAALGWTALKNGKMPEAMRRFNQAWLVDNANAVALWGMAAVESSINKSSESLKLFAEAEQKLNEDINFEVDYAKAMSIAGAQTKSDSLMADSIARFKKIYQNAPQHTANLQNWAICLFYMGDYAEAWQKIQLAERTPGGAGLDQGFISVLKSKMARPESVPS